MAAGPVPTHLSVPALPCLSHCKLLESRCKQYQKARERGCANLASVAVASASSINTNALITSPHTHCNKCDYSHPSSKCPAYGQQCYACSSSNHFTALCKHRRRWLTSKQTPDWGDYTPQRSHGKPWGCNFSHSPHQHHHQSPSHSTSHSPSPSASCSPANCTCPSNLTITIAMPHPTTTPRITLRSSLPIASWPATSLKAHSTPEVPLMTRLPSLPGSSCPHVMETNTWPWRSILVLRSTPFPWASTAPCSPIR